MTGHRRVRVMLQDRPAHRRSASWAYRRARLLAAICLSWRAHWVYIQTAAVTVTYLAEFLFLHTIFGSLKWMH